MYQEEVKSAIILLYLGILAGMDVRKRQISLVLTGVLFLAGIGWQILTVGIWLGFGQTFGVLTLGLILCSVLCGVLLMRKKIRKQDSIPLVPFLLLGFVGRCGML